MTMQTIKVGGNTKRSKLGVIEAQVPAFDELPEESQRFVIAYGLKQYIADGIAGAADRAAAELGVEERVRKLVEADFTRTRGEGKAVPDSIEQRALKLLKMAIRAAAKADGSKPTKEAVDERAEALLAGPVGERYKAEAASQLANEREMAELLSGLGDEPEDDDAEDEEDVESDTE